MPDMAGTVTYLAFFRPPGDGVRSWNATLPDLPGCVAAGSTYQETHAAIVGAVQMHLAGMRQDGERWPAPRSLRAIRLDAECADEIEGTRPVIIRVRG